MELFSWSNFAWFFAFGGSGVAFLIYTFQDYLLYFPQVQNARRYFIDTHYFQMPTPEEVFIRSSDNVKINLWIFRSEEPNRPTVLYFHGNAGSS
jgi:dipeptidyl aminopeptidase/acylaminoacyl peptidase